MSSIYQHIKSASKRKKKPLAVLIDPDKTDINSIASACKKINQSIATHVFVGGSEVEEFDAKKIVVELKKHTKLPVVLFPVDYKIISGVKKWLNIPLIVGGGIRSKETIELAYISRADMVVIGTAFEENENFFE